MTRYDPQRFVAVMLAAALVLSGVATVGVPIGVDDQGDVETTAPAVQEADALAVLTATAIAVTAATAGTAFGAYYSGGSDASTQSGAHFAVKEYDDTTNELTLSMNDTENIEEVRTMAYRQAEAAFARSMANGSSKVQAQQDAMNETDRYIVGVMQDEIVKRHNEWMYEVKSLVSMSGVSVYNSEVDSLNNSSGYIDLYDDSLVDDRLNVSGWTGGTGYRVWLPYTELSTRGGKSLDTADGKYTFTFSDSDLGDVTAHHNDDRLRHAYWQIHDIRPEVQTEMETFASNVNESQYEDMNASDFASPMTQALEWGQEYEDTGTSGYAAAQAAALGYDINGTSTVYEVTMNASEEHNTTYTGVVYADEATIPNGSVETGVVYDGDSTSAWLARGGGDGTIALDDDWRAESITLKDGTEVNSTDLSSYSRTEMNASNSAENLRELLELDNSFQDELDNSSGFLAGGGSVGGLLSGFPGIPGIPNILTYPAAALAALWVAWTRTGLLDPVKRTLGVRT